MKKFGIIFLFLSAIIVSIYLIFISLAIHPGWGVGAILIISGAWSYVIEYIFDYYERKGKNK